MPCQTATVAKSHALRRDAGEVNEQAVLAVTPGPLRWEAQAETHVFRASPSENPGDFEYKRHSRVEWTVPLPSLPCHFRHVTKFVEHATGDGAAHVLHEILVIGEVNFGQQHHGENLA